MSNYRIISSDNHVFEPPDLWSSRIEPKFKDRAPRVVRKEDGDWWFCDGHIVEGTGFGFGGSQTGQRFEDSDKLTFGDVFENIRPGGYIPEEQVKDMDTDGVDVGINYPTAGLQMFKERDSELLTAIFRAYNDWLGDFCSAAPKRLNGIAMINIDDIEVAVGEMERCRKLGFIGAMITARPPEMRRYDSQEYEPLWATAEDLEMPIGLHLDTNRLGSGDADGSGPEGFGMLQRGVNADHYVRMSLAEIILSGVFERYPKLQVGAVEYGAAWVPHFLERLDYFYDQMSHELSPYRFKENATPRDYFHRNVFVGFQDDMVGITLRDTIGVDNLTWGSDYPHQESTFPRSRQILDEVLADCAEEEKAKIAGGNAARIYNI